MRAPSTAYMEFDHLVPENGLRLMIDPEQWRGEFQNVVNMSKAGADPIGEEDVSPVIQREIGSDTLLYFPPGRYKMNSQVRRVGLRNLGIIGQNATLVHGKVDAIKGFDVTAGKFHGPAQHFKIGIPDDPHQGNSCSVGGQTTVSTRFDSPLGGTGQQNPMRDECGLPVAVLNGCPLSSRRIECQHGCYTGGVIKGDTEVSMNVLSDWPPEVRIANPELDNATLDCPG